MAAVWDTHFGFLYAKSTVIIGEWGGPLKDDAALVAARGRRLHHPPRPRRHLLLVPQPKQRRHGRHPPRRLDDATQGEDLRSSPLRSTRIAPRPPRRARLACVGSGKTLAPATSDDNYFRCREDGCVPAAQRCNGVAECADGSDEAACDFQPCVTVGGPDALRGVPPPLPVQRQAPPHVHARGRGRREGVVPHRHQRSRRVQRLPPLWRLRAGLPDARRRRGAEQRRCGGGNTSPTCTAHRRPRRRPRRRTPRTRGSSGSALALQAAAARRRRRWRWCCSRSSWSAPSPSPRIGRSSTESRKSWRSLDAEWAAQTQKVRSDAAPEAGGANSAGGDEEEWWWLDGNDEQQGPLSEAALLELAASGAIGDSTLIWSEALGDGAPWQEYSAVTSVDARGRGYI